MNKISITSAALTASFVASITLAAPATFDYRDMSDTSGLLLLKDARLRTSAIDGPVVRLTANAMNNTGLVEAVNKVSTTNFKTAFTWRTSLSGGSADATHSQGGDGVYLSLGSSSAAAASNIPVLSGAAVQIHFDTFKNASDPSSNSVQVLINGVQVGSGTVARPFDNSELWYAWVEATGTDLKIYAAHEETHPLNATVTIHGVDLKGLLGDSAYAALGGRTGQAYACQDVVSWSYCPVPTPGAAALLGLGGVALGRRRRA